MNSVDKVIFDTLAKRQNVVLPGVGSLQVKRRPAKKVSEDRIIPPQNVVVFTADEIAEAETVVTLLVAEGDRDEAQAQALWDEWLAKNRSETGVVTIKYVGEIRNGKMVVASQLHNELNPEEDEVDMEKERNVGPVWAWVLGGVLLAALIVAGILACKNGWFGCNRDETVEIVQAVVEVPPVEEPAPVVEPEPVKERFHIVAGTFAIEDNADNFVKKLKAEYPDLTIEKVYNPNNGRNMVSIYQTDKESRAHARIPMYWDIDLGLWVYHQK